MDKIKKKLNYLPFLTLILACLSIFIPPRDVFAAFSLSIRPYEGGFNLNFGKISSVSEQVSREVTVSITSDIAKQYRIVQTLLEPLTNFQGTSIPANIFSVYGIRGSNQGGTLNIEGGTIVSLGRQVIYTSDQAGTPDSFTIVYRIAIPPDIESGSYRGRLGFILEPVDSTQSPATAILNIFAEIEVESTIEIRTAMGTKNILLKPGKEQSGLSDVIANIKGGFGKQFRILQLVTEQPVSPEGKFLDWEAVKFIGSGAQKGIAINEPTPLSPQQQIIYTSSPGGGEDNFVISYKLEDLTRQKAGIYRAKVKYILEGVGFSQTRLIETLDLEIENPRIFDLVVSPEMGGSIRFRNLRPNEPPKVQEVILEVKTNTGKPYQVTQNTTALLTTKEGKIIPKEYFILKEESLDTKGVLKYPNKVEVKEGEMVLFMSDTDGSRDKFKVIYELTVPPDIHSGDYYTNFTYSVSEI